MTGARGAYETDRERTPPPTGTHLLAFCLNTPLSQATNPINACAWLSNKVTNSLKNRVSLTAGMFTVFIAVCIVTKLGAVFHFSVS